MHVRIIFLSLLVILISDQALGKGGLLKRFLEKPATKQLIMMNIEFGIPYDLANTLTNPLGKTLTAVSVIGVSIFLAIGLVLIPYNTIVDILDPDGLFPGPLISSRRKKRSLQDSSVSPSFSYFPGLLDVEDAFSVLDEKDHNCRKRLICDFHSIFSQLPTIFQKIIRFFTRHLDLRNYKQAAKDGLKGLECPKIYKQCRKSNMQILGQVFPNYSGGRRHFGRKNSDLNH